MIKRTRSKMDSQRKVLDGFRADVKQIKSGTYSVEGPPCALTGRRASSALQGSRSSTSIALRSDRLHSQSGLARSHSAVMLREPREGKTAIARSTVQRSSSQAMLAEPRRDVPPASGGAIAHFLHHKEGKVSAPSPTAAAAASSRALRPLEAKRPPSRSDSCSRPGSRGECQSRLRSRRWQPIPDGTAEEML